MDYGKRAPDLGWRMTDAWLSMAGAGSPGEPNGVPIDEWGIRMEAGSCNPVGASVSRGGEANGPAAVYAIREMGRMAAELRASGCGELTTSTSRCRRSAKATWPSRSSGTPPLPPTW